MHIKNLLLIDSVSVTVYILPKFKMPASSWERSSFRVVTEEKLDNAYSAEANEKKRKPQCKYTDQE